MHKRPSRSPPQLRACLLVVGAGGETNQQKKGTSDCGKFREGNTEYQQVT